MPALQQQVEELMVSELQQEIEGLMLPDLQLEVVRLIAVPVMIKNICSTHLKRKT